MFMGFVVLSPAQLVLLPTSIIIQYECIMLLIFFTIKSLQWPGIYKWLMYVQYELVETKN